MAQSKVARMAAVFLAIVTMGSLAYSAQSGFRPAKSPLEKQLIQQYFGEDARSASQLGETLRYELTELDLNDDKQPELVIMAAGQSYYGNTGFRTVILKNPKAPVAVFDNLCNGVKPLKSKHNGWHDIALGLPGSKTPVWAMNTKGQYDFSDAR